MAMASRDSVTVSMAEEARGMFRSSLRVKCVRVSTSGRQHGRLAEAAARRQSKTFGNRTIHHSSFTSENFGA